MHTNKRKYEGPLVQQSKNLRQPKEVITSGSQAERKILALRIDQRLTKSSELDRARPHCRPSVRSVTEY